ncbi:MAG: cupin domain-containing protein [Waltera sp.]
MSFLGFIVLSGEGELSYEEQTYRLSNGDCVFIDCRKAYSHSTSDNL